MISINLYAANLNIWVQFPSEWNELTQEELIVFCKHQLSIKDTNIAKAAIFFSWLKLRGGKQVPADIEKTINREQAGTFAMPYINAFFEENTLTNNLIPKLRKRFTTYYGPESEFNDLTCGEFEDCEFFWHLFNDEPGHLPLAKLAAVLYRPKQSGKRIPYLTIDKQTGKLIPYDIEQHLNFFINQPPWILYSIFTWYTGCRNLLPKIFPTCFEGDGSESGEPDPATFTKCIHSAAGPKNGTRDQVRLMNIKELFFEMEQETIKANELKQQYSS